MILDDVAVPCVIVPCDVLEVLLLVPPRFMHKLRHNVSPGLHELHAGLVVVVDTEEVLLEVAVVKVVVGLVVVPIAEVVVVPPTDTLRHKLKQRVSP